METFRLDLVGWWRVCWALSELIGGQEWPIWCCRGCERQFRGIPGMVLVAADLKRLLFCDDCGETVHYGSLRESEAEEPLLEDG